MSETDDRDAAIRDLKAMDDAYARADVERCEARQQCEVARRERYAALADNAALLALLNDQQKRVAFDGGWGPQGTSDDIDLVKRRRDALAAEHPGATIAAVVMAARAVAEIERRRNSLAGVRIEDLTDSLIALAAAVAQLDKE